MADESEFVVIADEKVCNSDSLYEDENEGNEVEQLINIAKPIDDRYVVMVDDEFLCVVKTEKEAEKMLSILANKYKTYYFEPGYNLYISNIDKYTIQVERSYKCFVISYEEVLKTISYYKVKMVELTKDSR